MNRAVATRTTVLLLLAAAAILPADARSQQATNAHAAALSHFNDRVKDYLALRDKVKASLTPPKSAENAWEITAQQQAFARGVRAARASAKEGDIFVSEVVPVFKQVIREDFSKRTQHQRAAALQGVPPLLGLKVNDEYPKAVPLATVPPKLLAAMPPLPDALEYRIAGRRLILHDTITNLVVDILEGAIPPQ